MKNSARLIGVSSRRFPFAVSHEGFLETVDEEEIGLAVSERKREKGEPIRIRGSIRQVRLAMMGRNLE